MAIADFSKYYLTHDEIKLLRKISKKDFLIGDHKYGHAIVQLWRLRLICSSIDDKLSKKTFTDESTFFTNDFYTSNFRISYIGEKYLVYRKETFVERKLPVIISLISLLLSIVSLSINALPKTKTPECLCPNYVIETTDEPNN